MKSMRKLKKALTIIGLTELEAKVYLKLLEIKEIKVTKLSKQTKVSRTQLYPLLEKLVEKGVLKKTQKRPWVYKVVDNRELLDLLKNWKKQQIKILRELEKKLKKSKKYT